MKSEYLAAFFAADSQRVQETAKQVLGHIREDNLDSALLVLAVNSDIARLTESFAALMKFLQEAGANVERALAGDSYPVNQDEDHADSEKEA